MPKRDDKMRGKKGWYEKLVRSRFKRLYKGKEVMDVNDIYWYHVVYSTGSQIGSVELGLKDDLFVPADIREYIEKANGFDFCALVNWKKLESNQISEDTLNKFLEKANEL